MNDEETLARKVLRARKAITDKVGKQRGVSGEIACPVCATGKLRYSIAWTNGRIHAGCTTDNCVRWME